MRLLAPSHRTVPSGPNQSECDQLGLSVLCVCVCVTLCLVLKMSPGNCIVPKSESVVL